MDFFDGVTELDGWWFFVILGLLLLCTVLQKTGNGDQESGTVYGIRESGITDLRIESLDDLHSFDFLNKQNTINSTLI